MMSTSINLVMTVIGFTVSTLFIVFVCTRLICARIHLNSARRSFAAASRSDLSILERGLHGLDPLVVADFPTRKYRDLCLASKENAQCTVCLCDYHEEDILRILPFCGHSFHATCIDIWLQQHSTCPVCRISLRELPDRKWFMQPMFSSATRPQYSMHPVNVHYCHCMANSHRRSPEPHNNPATGRTHDGDVIPIGDRDSIPVECDRMAKESANRKVECPSSR